MAQNARLLVCSLLWLGLAMPASSQDPFMATGSAWVGAQSHGISFDGTEWHIANFGGGWRVYDAAFSFVRQGTSPAGSSIRGLAYHEARGNLFLGDYGASLVHEVTTMGALLNTFSANVPSGFNAVVVNNNDDTLWLVGYQGDVVNLTATGALISAFNTPGLNWTGGAYDEARDTLLLLETGDRLYEYTPAGVQIGAHASPVDFVANNGQGMDYDSITGILHVTSQDGDVAMYQRGGAPPPPTCNLTGPMGVVTGDAAVDLDASSMSAAIVDITFEHSVDGGGTWMLSRPSAASPLATNPALGVPTGMASFVWDTAGDGVGTMTVVVGVLVRATVDDGVAPGTGQCQAAPFDVDNSALCQGLCGDCNLSGAAADILDALEAAQLAAGLRPPTMQQLGCCDIDSSLTITVLDALGIAQSAAGLGVTLTCP